MGHTAAAAFGYHHARYAESLAAYGQPWALDASRGWVLRRPIAQSPWHDAMGCYPLLAVDDWQHLPDDLAELGADCVSFAAVTDPFGDYTPELLRRCFPDVLVPFKAHYVVDLARPSKSFVSAHHRRNARRALATLTVERHAEPSGGLDDWLTLYGLLTDRHAIRGLQAFSRPAFATQLQVPGIVLLRAMAGAEIVGMHLWYLDQGIGYYHLGACSERGYQLGAAFALLQTAIDSFADRARWLSLGAGAGLSDDPEDGLGRFKRGWASETRTAYFGGRILQPDRYAELCRVAPPSEHPYFPAYRAGELTNGAPLAEG